MTKRFLVFSQLRDWIGLLSTLVCTGSLRGPAEELAPVGYPSAGGLEAE